MVVDLWPKFNLKLLDCHPNNKSAFKLWSEVATKFLHQIELERLWVELFLRDKMFVCLFIWINFHKNYGYGKQKEMQTIDRLFHKGGRRFIWKQNCVEKTLIFFIPASVCWSPGFRHPQKLHKRQCTTSWDHEMKDEGKGWKAEVEVILTHCDANKKNV